MTLWRNFRAELCLRCTCEAYNDIDGDCKTLKITQIAPAAPELQLEKAKIPDIGAIGCGAIVQK
jgi:hypothetical protein